MTTRILCNVCRVELPIKDPTLFLCPTCWELVPPVMTWRYRNACNAVRNFRRKVKRYQDDVPEELLDELAAAWRTAADGARAKGGTK